MEDDLMVMPEVAKSVCHSFWIAVGGDKGSIENDPLAVSSTTIATAPENPRATPHVQPQAAVQSEKADESCAVLKRHIDNGYNRKVLPQKSRPSADRLL